MADFFDVFLLQQLLNGLAQGLVYALIAIGFTLIFGVLNVVNFAHGEIYMLGAFIALISFLAGTQFGGVEAPMGLLLALVCTMVLTGLWGWAVERLAYRPLRNAPKLAPLISAIGMSVVLQNITQITQGARVKPLPPVIRGGLTLMEQDGLSVGLSYLQISIMVLTLVLMLVFTWIITRTPLGRAQRATEQDRKMAQLLGINVDRIISATFVIGATLAAVAGFMVTLYYGVIDFYIGFLAGIKAFTAAVLGGIGSLPGAMLGGLLIGLIESLWSGYFSIEYKDVAAFTILVLVLLFRPTGLLGRPDVEKV